MEISLDELVERGKDTMDQVCEIGQFFFPKLVIGRNDKLELGQYDSEFEQLQAMLQVIALNGPIDWIAHTADSYELVKPDPETERLVQTGVLKMDEMFEAGDERVTEAMIILTMTRFGFCESVTVPYKRLDARKLQWGEPVRSHSNTAGGRVIDALRDAIALSLV